MGYAITNIHKATLGDLLFLHAKGRATKIVGSAEKADTIFDVSNIDYEKIISEYL